MRTRVSWICALVSLAIWSAAHAAAPPLLPLQGVLTDADGVPLAAAVSVRFSLHTAETGGTEVWYETQTITPVDGLFAAYLGQGTGSAMTLATFRDEGELWLEVKVGADEPMARVRLASVAYAGFAEYCGNVPPHSHQAAELPAGVVIGAQSCGGSDKVRGVASTGALVCAPDLGTGADTLGQLNCNTGETVKWNGSVWACAVDNNSDSITAVNAGSGLSGSTVGTVATLSLSSACSGTEVLRYGGSSWQCSPAVQALTAPAAGGLAFTTTGATYNLTLKGGCGNGQVLKYNTGTSSWDCAADSNSGGDITDVLVAGNGGLAVTSPAGPQPTLSLMPCQVTGHVLKYTVGVGWDCAADDNAGGDITAVNTPGGGGIIGGATTGAANLTLMNCAASQSLRSAGATWGCVDDITAVNTPATGGLTGGGSWGTLNVGLKTCASGQVLKSVGTGWDCGGDNNSGGTVTSVATGAGLTGGPITITGTISIPNAGVTNAMLADSTVTVSPGTGLSGGGAVALGGTTTLSLATPVTVANGGTGAGTAANARTNLGAAASGVNGDITALSGLTQQAAIRVGPFGAAAGNTGEIRLLELAANGGQYVGFKAPDAIAANVIWTLPAVDGTSGQVLGTDGTGHLAWSSPTGGTVTSVTAGAGLTGGSITTSGTIAIGAGGVTNAMLANSGLTIDTAVGSGLAGGGAVALGGSLNLSIPAAGVTNAMLASSGLTINTAAGSGLAGGGAVALGGSLNLSIPAAGVTNAMLASSSVGVNPGGGLTGGGAVALGGTTTLGVDFAGSGSATTVAHSDHNHTGTFWAVSGNASTVPGTDYLGTSDNQPLELRVNGARALLVTPATTPNLVGGHPDNAVGGSVVGAVIGGGGATGAANSVLGSFGTVSGGYDNTAGTGQFATVPGGAGNVAAGAYSFAAGRMADASFDGCFVWADSTNASQACERANQFLTRAYGGAKFAVSATDWVDLRVNGSDLIATSAGATLTGGTWTNGSDRDRKEGLREVDPRDVLTRVAALPVTTWRYRGEGAEVRHMGPMAQDFHAAFGLGRDERTIPTVDADGVALAAIQGLHQVDGELRAENETLRARVRGLEQRVAQLGSLEQRVAQLEQARPARAGMRDLGWGGLGLLVVGGLVVARRRRSH
ncbi:MAG: tail fiber domain-containing protein [Deltaproteobacteria bacterium]|nr:tail fiber domain-containing protein [Deltaproteobacteria bacterium]